MQMIIAETRNKHNVLQYEQYLFYWTNWKSSQEPKAVYNGMLFSDKKKWTIKSQKVMDET